MHDCEHIDVHNLINVDLLLRLKTCHAQSCWTCYVRPSCLNRLNIVSWITHLLIVTRHWCQTYHLYIQFDTQMCSGSCTARSGQTASVAGEMEGLFFLWPLISYWAQKLHHSSRHTYVHKETHTPYAHFTYNCRSATSRLLIHSSISDAFLKRLVLRTKSIKVAEATDRDARLGPLVRWLGRHIWNLFCQW